MSGQNNSDSFPIQEFSPELLSRRGEVIAWLLSILMLITWLIVIIFHKPIFVGVPFLTTFLLISAIGISLGNWMDRQTRLTIRKDRILFRNGLRNVDLPWEKIYQVEVIPVGWGKKVRVLGEGVYFAFQTLGEVRLGGEVRGRTGFADGEQILQLILNQTKLIPQQPTQDEVVYRK